MINKFYFVFLAVALPAILRSEDVGSRQSFRYVISLHRDSTGGTKGNGDVEVLLSGKNFGSPILAFERIEGLAVEKGDRIRIDVPGKAFRTFAGPNALRMGSFLHRWRELGVKVELFRNEKLVPAHWVTWTDFFGNQGYVPSLDEATWIVDGERIGKGDALMERIARWERQGGLIIVILVPLRWLSPSTFPSELGTAYNRLTELQGVRKVDVLIVRPLDKDVMMGGG